VLLVAIKSYLSTIIGSKQTLDSAVTR